MRDLTAKLETELAKAVNKYRDTLDAAQQVFALDIQSAHQNYEVAAGLRVEQASKSMAEQISTFLGKTVEAIAGPKAEEQAEQAELNDTKQIAQTFRPRSIGSTE